MVDQTPGTNAETWVDHYGDMLYHFALARLGDSEAAEDMVQETFLAAVQSKDRFMGQSSEKTWLFGILKHKVIDYYREKKRFAQIQENGFDMDNMGRFFNAKGAWQQRPQHWRTNPGKTHEIKEAIDHFFSCLATLPQKTADVFSYREIDGLTTKEICNLLDISASNCWVILYRARMLLRKCMETAGFRSSVKD